MSENNQRQPITIRDAFILPGGWRNFSGKADQYTREGDRSFNIALPEEPALALRAAGLNVKSRENQDGDVSYNLKIAVSWKIKAPQIQLISGNTRTLLAEELVGILDDAEIIKADVMIDPSPYEVNGRKGIKAYLRKAFITIQQDELDQEYDHIPLASA